MDTAQWERDREKRREESLRRHARLHDLFEKNRFAFELERKKMLDEFFASVEDEDRKSRLLAFQKTWDDRMKHAGSPQNRLVLAKFFFWRHFVEKWQPEIQRFQNLFEHQ